MRRRRWQVLGVGTVFSAVLLYFALRDVDWFALGGTLADVRAAPLGFCALMMAAGILLRGWRWSLIAGRPLRTVATFGRATNLGVLGNQLLPGRLGEAVRVFALARMLPAGLSESLGSAVIDRALDALVLLFSAWLVSMVVAAGMVPKGWIAGLAILLAAFVVGLAVVRTSGFQSRLSGWSARWLHRWALRPESFLLVFNGMLRRLLKPKVGLSVTTVVAMVWLADYLAIASALWSAGLSLPVDAPLLLWVMLAAGSALPSAPGYVGIYQLASVWALAIYGVPPHHAVAVSFLLQAVTLVVSLVGAGGEVLRLRSSMTETRSHEIG